MSGRLATVTSRTLLTLLSLFAPVRDLVAQRVPDLQGTYDIATMTPIERPAEVQGRLVLTDLEAAAMERHEAERQAQADVPLDPNRAAPPAGGDTSRPQSYLEAIDLAAGGVVGGYNQFWLSAGSRVVTVNGQKRSSIIVDPPDGHIPPIKSEARARNAALAAAAVDPSASEGGPKGPPGEFDNPEQRPLAERCLLGFNSTSGPPTLPNYFYNNLKQIVQTPTTVMILNEMVHDVRVIRIGGTHLPSSIRRWNGDSVGRWEGNTLVVDTTNFTNKTRFQGSGEALHVIERFTRVDAKTLLYRFTMEDPETWDWPWTESMRGLRPMTRSTNTRVTRVTTPSRT